MKADIQTLQEHVHSMKQEMKQLKQQMVDREEIMTIDECEAYTNSLNSDNLVCVAQAKKQLGLMYVGKFHTA